jgi:CRP-like cAMP-binding protein
VTDAKEREIAALALFRGCRPAEVRWVASKADTLDLPAGRTVVREGETAREFVVLVRGTASSSDGDGSLTLAPGAFFGETGLIDGRPHGRTVETLTPARVLVFDSRAFRGMLHRLPAVGRKLLEEMVAQLRSIDQESRSLRAVS